MTVRSPITTCTSTRIIEGLTRRGLNDNTMVIVTADHGEEFWDHGSVGHGHSVYEELLHIPMFVRLPGVTHGATRVPDAVGLVDVLPTVLEALGQPIPEDLAGHSFLRTLTGEGQDAPRVAVSGFMEGWRTCAVGRLKFIQRTAEREILYNLSADPHEQTDIADSHPIAVRYMRGLLGLALAASDTDSTQRVATARRPVVHTQETTTIDAETESQLRALGYVGSSRR
jgi:choline-sulfatase